SASAARRRSAGASPWYELPCDSGKPRATSHGDRGRRTRPGRVTLVVEGPWSAVTVEITTRRSGTARLSSLSIVAAMDRTPPTPAEAGGDDAAADWQRRVVDRSLTGARS